MQCAALAETDPVALTGKLPYLITLPNAETIRFYKEPAAGLVESADVDCLRNMVEYREQLIGLEWVEPDHDFDDYLPGHWEWQGADIGNHDDGYVYMTSLIDPEATYRTVWLTQAPEVIRNLTIPDLDDRTAEEYREHCAELRAEARADYNALLESYA